MTFYSRVLIAFTCLFVSAAVAQAPCPLNPTNPSVTVCAPKNGASVSSPVNVVAGTTSSSTVSAMKVYLDGTAVYTISAGQLNTNLAMNAGQHRLTVKAWNKAGAVFSQSVNITVAAASGCTLSSVNPSVTICQPANGSNVTSPVRIVAGTTSSTTVSAMKIYLDGVGVYSIAANKLDTSIAMNGGAHRVTVKAWNSAGAVFSSAVNITVGSASVPTIQINANPTSIGEGGSSTLTWSSTNATSVNIQPGIGTVSVSGSRVVMPSSTTTYTATATGPGGSKSASTTVTVSSPDDINAIKHIIVMYQENRSFDNYFGKLNEYRRAMGLPEEVDGLPANAKNRNFSDTADVPAFKMTSVCHEGVSPSWNESHVQYNWHDPVSGPGLNDGYAFTAGKYARDNGYRDIEGLRAMGYYDWNELPYYYYMASQFAVSDRWFASVPSRTNPNRLYALGATSQGRAYPATGSVSFPSIFHELEAAGISWRVYMSDGRNSTLKYFQPFASEHAANFVDASQFAVDAANGTLPAVAMIDQASGLDEHPDSNIQKGAAWVASLINALMKSPSWKDSVFILGYDEGGGMYDHVAPPPTVNPDGIPPNDLASTDIPGDFTRYGFRIPNIIISPFTKKHYVSHITMDHTSVLRLIQKRFGLATLTLRDSQAHDMTDFFDFVNVPWTVPPTPPVQPTNGPCYYDRLP